MSITVSDCFEIARSCLNTSKAKQLYSFPKEHRFTVRPTGGAPVI